MLEDCPISVQKFQIALVEDNSDLRNMLSGHFQRSPQFECVFSCDTVEKFIKYYRDFIQIDVLLLDLNLYGKSSADELPKLRKLLPQTKIIIFSVDDDELSVKRTFAFSADGYLTKDLMPDELEHKLSEMLLASKPAVSERIVKRLIENVKSRPDLPIIKHELSKMEEAILLQVIQGNNNSRIADIINISVNGIKYHIKNLNRKLDAHNRAELIAKGSLLLKRSSN